MPITNARVVMCALHLWLTTMAATGGGRPAKRMCAAAQQRKAQELLRIGGNGGWELRKMTVSGPKQHASGKNRTPLRHARRRRLSRRLRHKPWRIRPRG